MNKNIAFTIILSVFLVIDVFSASTTTLSFRINSPRIIRTTNNATGFINDCFEYNVEVKGSNATSRLWALDMRFTYDSTVVDTLDFSLGSYFVTGSLTPYYQSTLTKNSGNLNVAVTSLKSINSTNTAQFKLIPSSWTVVGTIRLTIINSNGVPNIALIPGLMDGAQQEKIFVSPWTQVYLSPNIYSGQNLATTYMGRIYSSTYGWSQIGGTIDDTQFIDWTTAVNTSVWDTLSSAAAITGTGNLANALRIHLGARLAINAGANLTCSGPTEINNPKGLWIVSSTSGTGSFIDNGTITYNTGGTALVERSFDLQKWHGYSIPFNTTSVIPYRGIYMKYWTESNHNFHYIIVPAPLDSTLTGSAFRGYMAWSPSSSGITKVYPQGYLNTGTLSSIPATRTESTGQSTGNGYNLLGNPYPSALDLGNSGIGWNLLDQKAWVWSPSAGNYLVYVKGGSGNTHSQYIPPEQAFFVHHVEASTGSTTLDLTNSARTHTLVENFLKDSPPDVILLTASSASNGKMDLSTVYFSAQATAAYDETMDAGKLTGDNDAPQLYSVITDRNLTINAIPWTGINQVVPLGFSCGVSGNFTITASNLQSFRQGTDILLKDMKLNQTQSLIQDSVYSFSYQTGESAGRFELLFSNPYYGVPAQDAGSIRVYAFDEDVYVRLIDQTEIHGTIKIIDQIGRMVFTGKLENKPVNQFHPGLLQGYYVVMVQTDQSLINRKIYLK